MTNDILSTKRQNISFKINIAPSLPKAVDGRIPRWHLPLKKWYLLRYQYPNNKTH